MVFPKSSYTVDLLIFPTRTLVAIHGIKFHASQVFFPSMLAVLCTVVLPFLRLEQFVLPVSHYH